jgi:thiol-disulfide isomerase/thioredoxin
LPRVTVSNALVALMLFGAAAPALAQSGVGLPLGTRAPSAGLEDLEGNEVDLLDYVSGRPALIEFWATWCENCEALQPQLDRIHAEHGEELVVVAVAVGVAQSIRRVRRHVEEHEPGYAYLWDGKGAAVRAYKAPTTSVVVLLDAAGSVVYTGAGGDQDLVSAVAELLDAG